MPDGVWLGDGAVVVAAGVVEGTGAGVDPVVVGVVEVAGVGARLVVIVAVEGVEAVVEPEDAREPDLARAFFLRCECFEAAFVLPAPVELSDRLLVVLLVTLVLEELTPDEYEPEACFDRMGTREMDAGAAETDLIEILSGLGVDPFGAPSDGAGSEETTRGAATTQVTSASVVSVIMPARTMSNGRSPQTGLIDFILSRIPRQHYPVFGGRRLL